MFKITKFQKIHICKIQNNTQKSKPFFDFKAKGKAKGQSQTQSQSTVNAGELGPRAHGKRKLGPDNNWLNKIGFFLAIAIINTSTVYRNPL